MDATTHTSADVALEAPSGSVRLVPAATARGDMYHTALDRLIDRLLSSDPGADAAVVRYAFTLAEAAHRGQFRQSGEPYIAHPLAVAELLLDLGLEAAAISAALLHDVVEDTSVTLDQITREFGSEIAHLVDGVTKFTALESLTREEIQAGTYRKMFIAMADDPRVVLVKLADRLHNMRTLGAKRSASQQRVAQETLEIYAPLAHRLGIWGWKRELEDLGLRYFEPELYADIARRIEMHQQRDRRLVDRTLAQVQDLLEANGLQGRVESRMVQPYQVYAYLANRHAHPEPLFSRLRLRVLVDEVNSCYRMLGLIHSTWRPLPNAINDFIASPKENLYQSLHTVVVLPNNRLCQFQIRTFEMDETAHVGVAAYLRASRRANQGERAEVKITWLRSLLDWQRDLTGREFVETLRHDILHDQVYAVTPRGRVIDLPVGATALDFAYRIHTEIGHTAVSAEINGEPRPLDHRLANGELVKIITSRSSPGPSIEWLNFVVTANARTHIRRWLKRQSEEVLLERGHLALDAELGRLGLTTDYAAIAKVRGLATPEELLLAIGRADLDAREVATGLLQVSVPAPGPETNGSAPLEVAVPEAAGRTLRLARCCNPQPREDVVGYATREGTISIHRQGCPYLTARGTSEHLLPAQWVPSRKPPVDTSIVVEAQDRIGLVHDIVTLIADLNINVTRLIQLPPPSGDRVGLLFSVHLHDPHELLPLLASIHRIPSVMEVRLATT